MKNRVTLALVILTTISCGQKQKNEISPKYSSPTPFSTTASNSDASPKVLDVPNLVGKSQDEVKKLLGNPAAIDRLNPTDTTGEISFDYKFDQGSGFINFKNGKANYFHFNSKKEFGTLPPLGMLVGVDLTAVTPTYSNAAQTTYLDTRINGVSFKEVRASVDGRYTIITFRVE